MKTVNKQIPVSTVIIISTSVSVGTVISTSTITKVGISCLTWDWLLLFSALFEICSSFHYTYYPQSNIARQRTKYTAYGLLAS